MERKNSSLGTAARSGARCSSFLAVLAVFVITLTYPRVLPAQEFPAGGFDEFPTRAQLQVYSDADCTIPELPPGGLIVQGPTRVKRSDPVEPEDGRTEIQTEIVTMSLTASSSALVIEAPGGSDPNDPDDPPCPLPGCPSADNGATCPGGQAPGCSPGQIKAKEVGSDFPADSFFNLLVEAIVPGLGRVFNKTPVVMRATIEAIPPAGTIYGPDPPDACIPLFSACTPTSDTPVAYLGHVNHKVIVPGDHLKCYKVKDPLRLKGLVDLDSAQFGLEPGCQISKAKFFCAPVTKTVIEAKDGKEDIELIDLGEPEVVVETVADSCVVLRSGQTGNSEHHGQDQHVCVGLSVSEALWLGLVTFDLPPLPDGAEFTGADLQLDLDVAQGTPTSSINACRAGSAWTESGVNWDNQPPASTPCESTDVGTDPRYYVWDVTEAVDMWYAGSATNDGFVLSAVDDDTINLRSFHSRESSGSPPRLAVRYRKPPQPSTLTDADRICYKIKCPKTNLPGEKVTDQFGTRTLTKFKAQMLCVPAIKGAVP